MSAPESNAALEQEYLRALAVASQNRDMERAFAIGEEAVSRGVEHFQLLGLAAQRRMRMGDVEGAFPLLRRASELKPRHPDILNDLGLCLMRLNRPQEALEIFDTGLRSNPVSTKLLFNKALACEMQGLLDEERATLDRVIAGAPNHVPALNLLALLAADRNDAEGTRYFAERALAISPGEVLSRIALGMAEAGERNYASARQYLEPLLSEPGVDPENRAMAQTLLGDIFDGEKKYGRAFEFYAAAKKALHDHYAPHFAELKAETPRARVARLTDYFKGIPAGSWRSHTDGVVSAKPRTHIFLTGFLRSGTTLLGQILAGHPDIDVMHERECLGDAKREFMDAPDGLSRLAALDGPALDRYRESYWNNVRSSGHALLKEGFVDKWPIATSLLPLAAKLFPDAKVLFVGRDPRDVALSCFRRRFAMTEEKFAMLSLQDITAYYLDSMALNDLYREKLGLTFFEARHETLLADLDGETRRICDFLGVPWNDAMLNFAGRAAASNIDIPNSADLARGLSRDGEGHWRHYKAELAPVLPMLAPLCARLGYPEN